MTDYRAVKGKRGCQIVPADEPQHCPADETSADLCGFLRCPPDAEENGAVLEIGIRDKGDVYRRLSIKSL